jgi:hypothetical protein
VDNREQADAGVGLDRIRPAASPVDTYVRPNQNSGLSQLAESLKGIAPEVAKYSDVEAARQSESQKEAGARKARELFDSGTSYKDAIKKGLISPQESPWFQLGAKEQYGRVAAGKFSTDLTAAVAQDPTLQDSTDVAQYDKFAQNFKQQWTADNIGEENRGLNFEHGFGSMAEQYGADERSHFVAQAGERLVKSAGDNTYQEVSTLYDHETGMHTDPKAIAQGINLVQDRMLAMGLNPHVVNAATVKAIGDIVMRDGDVSAFDILKTIKGGSGDLYHTGAAQAEIQKVTAAVYENQQRHAVADRETQDAARKDAIRTQTSGIALQLLNSANPSRENIDAAIKSLAVLDPKEADNMKRFRDNVVGDKFNNDTNSMQGTLADIFTKTEGQAGFVDVHTLVGMVNAHQINAQGFSYLKGELDKRDEEARRVANDPREHNVYTDPQFTHSMTGLRTLIGNEFDPNRTPETAQRIDGASAEFGTHWLEYMAGPGKTSTPLEKNKFLTETQQIVADKWRPTDTQAAVKGAQPPIPAIDIRSPAVRDQVKNMAHLVAAQEASGTYSPGVTIFLRQNKLFTRDAIDKFVKQYNK